MSEQQAYAVFVAVVVVIGALAAVGVGSVVYESIRLYRQWKGLR